LSIPLTESAKTVVQVNRGVFGETATGWLKQGRLTIAKPKTPPSKITIKGQRKSYSAHAMSVGGASDREFIRELGSPVS
jgi:hypothetical protein